MRYARHQAVSIRAGESARKCRRSRAGVEQRPDGNEQKNGPESVGASLGGTYVNAGVSRVPSGDVRRYRPKCGRSPLRTAMRALAISQRSIVASNRVKIEV